MISPSQAKDPKPRHTKSRPATSWAVDQLLVPKNEEGGHPEQTAELASVFHGGLQWLGCTKGEGFLRPTLGNLTEPWGTLGSIGEF